VVLACLAAVVSSGLVMAAHGARGFFLPVVAMLVCLLAALFDGYTARIPNPLTYPAIVLGLLLNGMVPVMDWMNAHAAVVWLGAAGPASSLMGFGACAILGVIGCLAAGVHGGDLKLLAGVGALLGLLPTANVLIMALALALVYALLNLAFFGGLNKVVRVGAMRGLELIYLRRFETPVPEEGGKGGHIPMAVPLAVGLVAAQVWQMRTGGGVL
jgi:prepilin signal peptidase PulO-like enzyme (type II secretory pathway)